VYSSVVQILGHTLLSLVGRYGYPAVFFGVMLESTGVPLPGETVLIASGALVHQGVLDLGDVLFFGILGAVTGDQMGYWVGRKGGRPFVLVAALVLALVLRWAFRRAARGPGG
jgi:membrane protein DedA with SNARE-associated domain